MLARRIPFVFFSLAMSLVAACGSDGGSSGDDGGGGPDGAPGTPDAGNSGYERLIEASWTLPAGTEGYVCAYKTVDRDMFVGEFAPVIPLGTHHTVLTMGDPSGPDRVEPCDAATNSPNMIFGSGVGTVPFVFPPGVAVRIPAGKQLVLNLHLYNTDDTSPLSGLSGTDVRLLDPSEVQHEAESILAGKVFGLTVPPGSSTSVGGCTLDADQTIFAVGAHMHKLGVHLKNTALPVGAAPIVLLDTDYSFDSQLAYHVDPMVTLHAGDSVSVECTYENTTAQTVFFGDSSDDEMCFSGLYWYPARGTPFVCAN